MNMLLIYLILFASYSSACVISQYLRFRPKCSTVSIILRSWRIKLFCPFPANALSLYACYSVERSFLKSSNVSVISSIELRHTLWLNILSTLSSISLRNCEETEGQKQMQSENPITNPHVDFALPIWLKAYLLRRICESANGKIKTLIIYIYVERSQEKTKTKLTMHRTHAAHQENKK